MLRLHIAHINYKMALSRNAHIVLLPLEAGPPASHKRVVSAPACVPHAACLVPSLTNNVEERVVGHKRCFSRSRLACLALSGSNTAQPPEQPSADKGPGVNSQEEFEGLEPEDDQQVPGTYTDAMNGNTKLGKAVKSACKELQHLNSLEQENLHQAQDLLKKLGFKFSLVTDLPPSTPVQDDDDSDAVE